MPNEWSLQGTDRFVYVQDNGDIVENKIIVPFSQVFRYIDNDNIEAYTLENFYNHVRSVFQEPMYIYYGNLDPVNYKNINIWIDTSTTNLPNQLLTIEEVKEALMRYTWSKIINDSSSRWAYTYTFNDDFSGTCVIQQFDSEELIASNSFNISYTIFNDDITDDLEIRIEFPQESEIPSETYTLLEFNNQFGPVTHPIVV